MGIKQVFEVYISVKIKTILCLHKRYDILQYTFFPEYNIPRALSKRKKNFRLSAYVFLFW